jgi:hypothetical protein
MVRSTFDWSLWIILVFDGLAHSHDDYIADGEGLVVL